MKAPDSILRLAEKFHDQLDYFRAPNYNETLLRRDFLDPFLEALGWDTQNRASLVEFNREVIHEARVIVDGRSRAPDYACSIGGKWKFFLEAKKPSVNIKENPDPAFQLRSY